MKFFWTSARVVVSMLSWAFPVFSQSGPTSSPSRLYETFKQPGNIARPRVWWHWMQGNVTQSGIRKDLEWMHRSGIGGFHNFDAGLFTPQVVDKRLAFMTPDWKQAFGFATRLADSLGLEMAIAGSPGWSQSGGPWVPARNGMKKLVWREMQILSGAAFNGVLPKPFTTTGTFQNIPIVEEVTAFEPQTAPPPEYYEDVAVLAFRLPPADKPLSELMPIVTASGGHFTLAQLTDNDLSNSSLLPADPAKGYAWLQFEFKKPQTIKALTLVGGGARDPWGSLPPAENRWLDISDDGIHFKPIVTLPLGGVDQQTITIPVSTARFFRIRFKNPTVSPYATALVIDGQALPKPAAGTSIAEVVLHPVTRINHIEEKAGFASPHDIDRFPSPVAANAVKGSDVIDLTDKLNADGTLNWTPPVNAPGAPPTRWKIIRFGYSLTGKKNHPASPEATGLEVDKMDAQAVKGYFENYLDQYEEATGGLIGNRGLQYLVTDSYEAGQETWTPQMAQEFHKRRGYSLLPWMPVFTGQVVNSTQASEQFLWDWRKTISELIAENYYDQLTQLLAKRGMKRYSESHENGRLYVVDGMDVKRTAAVPMSAMWVPSGWGASTAMAKADIQESASVAHIYGQNLAAAESLTAFGLGNHAWSYSPETLKPVADLEMANGLNRFVIHTSVHQPVDDKVPGLGLFVFGQWFNRHETWAHLAKSWTDYLSRSSAMLQQGTFVADVLYYYGEDNNITGLFGHKLPAVPAGYKYDFLNPHALLNLVSVKDGRLVTPSGMSYRLLVLDANARRMSLPVLRKITRLVQEGAIVSGIKPDMTPSRSDDQQEFKRLVEEVWQTKRPNVSVGKSISEILTALNVQPDFAYTGSQPGVEMLFVHRRLDDGDIYWVNNRSSKVQRITARFRVTGKVPQIWHPETGQSEPASYRIEGGHTSVWLDLTPNDAVFIVFEQPASQPALTLRKLAEAQISRVDGGWSVAFQPGRGAPASASFDMLTSWTQSPLPGIKYFSGTATYSKAVRISSAALAGKNRVWLDLGEVKNLAQVFVNGQAVGVVWKPPFRVDVTGALKAGDNRLDIQVTNLWVNRLIGDQQPTTLQKFTFTTLPFYKANSTLLPSGLIGPVRVLSTSR